MTSSLTLRNEAQPPRTAPAPHYDGPERRSPRHAGAWLTCVLDEIDYGTVVLNAQLQVVHANHRARMHLARVGVVRLEGTRLRVVNPADATALSCAIDAARVRELRRIIVLGEGDQRTCVGVVPLPGRGGDDEGAVLLIIERAAVCEALSVRWFAVSHALTPTEAEVLQRLCSGSQPAEVARRHGVSISTIRTQINTIRQKTGAQSVSALIRAVARLPPLVGALRLCL